MPPKAAPKPTAKPAAAATKAPAAKPSAPTAKPAAKPTGKAATPAPKTAAAPQAKQSATSSKAASGNGVHIKGLTKESVADVKTLFASAGNVTNVRLRRRKFALVWFDSASGATKAVQQFNGKQHNGKQLAVHAAKAQPKPDKATTAVSIFVSPIFRQTTSRAQLRTLFADCGKITRIRQYKFNYAFIRFDGNAAVQNALKQKNGKQFFNKTLVVKASVRK